MTNKSETESPPKAKLEVDKQLQTARSGFSALNYAQVTRAIFHYYDSILASHNRAGVAATGDHYPCYVASFFID